MKSLRIELSIDLNQDVVEEQLQQGYSEQDIIERVEKHILEAVGSHQHNDWQLIENVDCWSMGVS